jgi:uncharacterized protein YecA (UPF0149 family)
VPGKTKEEKIMDTRTGEIMSKELLKKLMGDADFEKYAKEVAPDNLSPDQRAMLAATGRTKVGRNEKCPCGSGKKFKYCCRFKVAKL